MGEYWSTITNSYRKNEEPGPNQKWDSVVGSSSGEYKFQCCKEQYWIVIWNVRSINRSKLKAVKREIARVNIDISGISELKWMRMGKFNSDDYYIYYYGQESLRRNGVALIVNQRVWNAVLECNLKNKRMILVCFQGKSFNITVIQVCAQPLMPKRLTSWPTTASSTNTKKRCPFYHKRLEC